VLDKNGTLVYGAPESTELISSAFITFVQAGAGAIERTVQAKLRESVSVKDFGAVGDGVADDTVAIENALAASNNVYFPAGIYLTTKAVRLTFGKSIYGDGKVRSTIRRTNTTPETISGESVVAVVYVSSRYNKIQDIQVAGDGTSTPSVDGIHFGNLGEICNNSDFTNIRVVSTRNAVFGSKAVFMCTFNQITVTNSQRAFYWPSPSIGSTSLTFNSCWAENCGDAYDFYFTLYTTFNSCGADLCNYGSTPPPGYTVGFGNRASSRGVYNFNLCSVTLNSCASENSWGNGVFKSESSGITLNSCSQFDCKSEFVPDYATYGDVAVGPIYVDVVQPRSIITINNPKDMQQWQNTVVPVSHPTRPISTLLAFNYLESVYGDLTGRTLAVITSTDLLTSNAVKGINSAKYCKTIDQLFRDPVFIGRVSQGSKFSRQINVSGSGTVITIPFVSQGLLNRKHKLTVSGINNESNGTVSNAFSVDIGCTSLTSLSNLTSGNLFGVASVAISGLNLNITLPSSVTGARIYVDVLSEAGSFIDLDNISIA
jgi:hypothetical protein